MTTLLACSKWVVLVVAVALVVAFSFLVFKIIHTPGQKDAGLYVMFDASDSASKAIEEGFKESAVETSLTFCNDHHEGRVFFGTITASVQRDSLEDSILCPAYLNNTQYRTALLIFEREFKTKIDGMIEYRGKQIGTDIIGKLLSAALTRFNVIRSKNKFILIYSDMQQSGDGIRQCVLRSRGRNQASCVAMYYQAHPEYARVKTSALKGVPILVAGVGRTVIGPVPRDEYNAYVSFWQNFFRAEEARICWYGPDSGSESGWINTEADGSLSVNTSMFSARCEPYYLFQ